MSEAGLHNACAFFHEGLCSCIPSDTVVPRDPLEGNTFSYKFYL